MYNEVLEEFFGADRFNKTFGNTTIREIGFIIRGPRGTERYVPEAVFGDSGTVGYARAMLRTAGSLRQILISDGGVSIRLSKSRNNPQVAHVLVTARTGDLADELYLAMHAATIAIHEYGDRLRESF